MNYIQLINQYWEIERERGDFTAQVQSLYFALLYFANRNGWKPFKIYREDVMERAKIAKKSYYSGRDILKKAGLISFEEGSANTQKCSYQICNLSSLGDITGDKAEDKQGDITGDKQGDYTIKHINIETNKHNNNAPELSLIKIPAKPKRIKRDAPVLFQNSLFYNKDYFKAFFEGSEYEKQNVDFDYYYLEVQRWATKKNITRLNGNWAGSIEKFMLNDIRDRRLVTKSTASKKMVI